MRKINYGSHQVDLNDLSLIKRVLKSNYVTQGNFVKNFENKVSSYLNSKYAVSCNSGTAAIHMAFDALNINSKSIIIMPIINFISSYGIAKLLGAKVYLADINCRTGQIEPENIEDCIKKHNLKKVDLLVTMYLGGDPKNCFNFFKLKKKYNFKIMEDACHAFGAAYKYKNKYVKIGSCLHSDICVFSFHPLKTITTGEGGMLTTGDKKIFEKARLFRSHGILRKNNLYWKNSISNFGMNYRLSDINCALGISQLKKVNKFLKHRNKIYRYYEKNIRAYKDFCEISHNSKNNKSANHLMVILFDFNKIKVDKDFIFNFFRKRNIFLQYHYQLINKYKIFSDKKPLSYQGALKFNQSAISFPTHVNLELKDLDKIFNILRELIRKYKKNKVNKI